MSNLRLGYRRIQIMLTWALGLSWVPLFVGALVAASLQEPLIVLAFGIVLIVWLIRLGDLFDLFEAP